MKSLTWSEANARCCVCVNKRVGGFSLRAGADANAAASRKGWKPLMAAAKSGDPDVMRMLLDAGADHEARYPNGKTPLYCAAEWGRLGAVRVLLEAGARPEVAADRLLTDWRGISIQAHQPTHDVSEP